MLQSLCFLRLWLLCGLWTNRRSEFRHFVKGKKKLDCCEVCAAWDKSVVPKMTKLVNHTMCTLECTVKGCFDEFKKLDIADKFNERPTEFVKTFVRHIEKVDAGPHASVALHAACSAEKWTYTRPNAWVDVCKWFEWHFSVRDRMLVEFDVDYYTPALSTLYFLMDFMASTTLPLGYQSPHMCGNVSETISSPVVESLTICIV